LQHKTFKYYHSYDIFRKKISLLFTE
jgi:hypothetical protein